MTSLFVIEGNRLSGRINLLLGTVLLVQLSACAPQPVIPVSGEALQFSTEEQYCRDMLASADIASAEELDSTKITLVNWNVRKTREQKWHEDFATIANDADLVLFQEASLREESIGEIDASRHWSFAPGYRKRGEVTGVMTLSSIKPVTQCSFVHSEPLLRTPKATSITQYGLSNTDETLVVVNVHGVNFSLGLGAFDNQFRQIADILDEHTGPVILSGDLNTWRPKRKQIIEKVAAQLDLHEVYFATDHRVKVFGQVLDHIYVRGLSTVESTTEIVKTSDHNPMSVIFSR